MKEAPKACLAAEVKRWYSREAAKECSPRRKPWVFGEGRASPEGAKENLDSRKSA